MGNRLTDAELRVLMQRTRGVLAEQARARRPLTYLELADRVAMPGPQRIHRLTRLLEKLMKEDADAGRPLAAALVVSRVGHGLPAQGFFDRARRLGVFDGEDPQAFHHAQLEALFAASGSVAGNKSMDV